MLDTFMAVWNRNYKENRRKAGRVGLTFFFLCISMFLLLFAFNISFLSALPAKKHVLINKVIESNQTTVVPVTATAASSVTPIKTATIVVSTPCVRVPSPPTIGPIVRATIPWQESIVPQNHIKGNYTHPKRTPIIIHKQIVPVQPTAKITATPIPKVLPTATATPTAVANATDTPTATPEPTASPVTPDSTATVTRDLPGMFTTFSASDAQIRGFVADSNTNKANNNVNNFYCS